MIAMFLYQNEEVRQKNMPLLKRCNDDPAISFLTFKPYFHNDSFPSSPREAGNTSAAGASPGRARTKSPPTRSTSTNTSSPPLFKRGLFLGFDQRSREKIGEPYGWIRTARDQREVSQQDFYKHVK